MYTNIVMLIESCTKNDNSSNDNVFVRVFTQRMPGMAEESHGESHHDLSSHSGTHGNESTTGNCDSMGFGNMESMSIDDGECNSYLRR